MPQANQINVCVFASLRLASASLSAHPHLPPLCLLDKQKLFAAIKSHLITSSNNHITRKKAHEYECPLWNCSSLRSSIWRETNIYLICKYAEMYPAGGGGNLWACYGNFQTERLTGGVTDKRAFRQYVKREGR